jgi:hypothetical protein
MKNKILLICLLICSQLAYGQQNCSPSVEAELGSLRLNGQWTIPLTGGGPYNYSPQFFDALGAGRFSSATWEVTGGYISNSSNPNTTGSVQTTVYTVYNNLQLGIDITWDPLFRSSWAIKCWLHGRTMGNLSNQDSYPDESVKVNLCYYEGEGGGGYSCQYCSSTCKGFVTNDPVEGLKVTAPAVTIPATLVYDLKVDIFNLNTGVRVGASQVVAIGGVQSITGLLAGVYSIRISKTDNGALLQEVRYVKN